MGSYENFARVYDELMDNVPYEEWAQFILNLLQDRKITEGLVLELGCGTGKLMTLLGKAGFDMIGVDNSVEMLQIAREKTSQDFLYLLQDMSCLLYTSDAADDSLRVDLGGRRIIKKKFFQAEDGIRDRSPSRGLGDVYKRQEQQLQENLVQLGFQRIEYEQEHPAIAKTPLLYLSLIHI